MISVTGIVRRRRTLRRSTTDYDDENDDDCDEVCNVGDHFLYNVYKDQWCWVQYWFGLFLILVLVLYCDAN